MHPATANPATVSADESRKKDSSFPAFETVRVIRLSL